jgi:hypothetical protein
VRSGAGLYYLNWGGRNFSIRAGRETEMIKQRLSRRGNKISLQQMKEMQAGVVLNDARRRKGMSPKALQRRFTPPGAAAWWPTASMRRWMDWVSSMYRDPLIARNWSPR